jgi:sugar phosphate isomerase/epimerase
MSTTRTGQLAIGFRRGGSPWQQDIGAVAAWAKANDFSGVDTRGSVEEVQALTAAGLRIGSVDLAEWRGMISPDPAKRAAAVARNREQIQTLAPLGAKAFFTVMLPEQPDLPRAENFKHMVAGYTDLMPALEAAGAQIVIEGWPGPGALCCTPETVRAFFKECPSRGAGFNYDPSHLIRMGIDPLRFLREFVNRIGHVHAKDTELLDERRYELGTEQPAALTPGVHFGGTSWRYTIPGHGQMHWTEAFGILAAAGYTGMVAVELEDGNFNGTEAGEQQGLVFSRQYLEGC